MEKEKIKRLRYTKDDVLNLIIFLSDGEKSAKEIVDGLGKAGLLDKRKSETSTQRYLIVQSLIKATKKVLGESSITDIKKTISGTSGKGGIRGMRYFSLTISPDEAFTLLEKNTLTTCKRKMVEISVKEEEKQGVVNQEISSPETPLHEKKSELLGVIREIMHFFENAQNYSPRQFEDLLNKVAISGFNSKSTIEVVISSFKEAELEKIEEIEKKFLGY